MSEGLPSKPLQPARPLTQVHLSPGSAEEAIASLRAFGTSFPQAAGSQAAQTSTTLQVPTVPVTEQSQQPQTGAAPARKPRRRRQPRKTQAQASTSQLSLPQGSQEVHQLQTEAPPSQKARQPRKSLKRSIDSVEPSASQEGPAIKKPALQVSQPTQPESQALPSAAALQVPQQAQQSQTEALHSQKAKQPRKSLKRSIDSVEPSASQEGPATKKPALEVSQPAQSEVQAPPSTVALQLYQPTQPEVEAPPSTVALQLYQPTQSGIEAPASTIDLPPHQPAQQLQSQAPRTDPTPGGWWEVPGFSEPFKQYHRDRCGKEGTLRPFVVQGIINLAIAEHRRLHAAARQAAENQGATNPTAPQQETDPASAGVQALVTLSGGPSSEMGVDNQQTAIDLPIDPQLQAEYDASSMDPRAHTLHIGGVRLSQVGLGPDPALPKDDVDGRFKMIEFELKNQIQPGSIPIPPPSLHRPAYKEFVCNTYVMPPGVEDARLEKVLVARNDIILNERKKLNLVRNNTSAKGTRVRREEKAINLRELTKMLQVQMNWWRLKAVSLGADPREWNAVSEDLKEKMSADMDKKVCEAESAQLERMKRIKSSEHSARNTEIARLNKLDVAKKEKEVQAIMAAIEAKDRERQEAQLQGQELPEIDLGEFIKMTFPDDEAHADTTTAAGDTAEAPTPINDNQNDSIHANTSGSINTDGAPIESTAKIGESADAGGAIESANTTDVNNTMDVGIPINNDIISLVPGNTMDGNAQTMGEDALNTGNMASASTMDNSSLLPNNWAMQPYTQIVSTPNMSMDSQGAPVNNYGMQNNDMQSNDMQSNGMQYWVPGGTAIDTEFQGGALDDFNPQNNNFLNLGLHDNGFMQSNLQDTPFATDDMQNININITTNGFQRITALDDSTQLSNYPMQDSTPLDTSLYGNVSFGNSTQCSTSLDNSVQGEAGFDTSAFSNASIDSGTPYNASFDINFQDNTSVNYGLQGNLPTNNSTHGAAPYNNLIQGIASSSTNPQGNGNATKKQKPNRVTKTTKPSRANKSNGRNVKKPETVRREITGADLPRVANPVSSNSFNPAVLARARLDHIDPTDRYAFGGRPPSASQQILTPRACDFANDKHLTYENSFTSEGNKSLFEANYSNYELYPSDDERNQF